MRNAGRPAHTPAVGRSLAGSRSVLCPQMRIGEGWGVDRKGDGAGTRAMRQEGNSRKLDGSWALGKRAGGVWGLGIKRFVLEEAETGDWEELPGS